MVASGPFPPAIWNYREYFLRKIAIVVAAFLAANSAIGFHIRSAQAADMPPLSADNQVLWDYYKLKFLPDGYPGKQLDTGLVPHPLYGTYAINDYIRQYRKTGDERFLAAMKTVADAAIRRMEDVDGALVFYYQPDGLSSLPGKWYSGLTQGEYLQAFEAAAEITGDPKYRDAAQRVFKSLTIPADRGGVARPFRDGIAIEEWGNPHVGDYTLNGWTNAVLVVGRYATATGSPAAKELFDKNILALKYLLPLYDLPDLANSRYRLSGYTSVRLTFAGTTAVFEDGSVEAPDQNKSVFQRDTDNRWSSNVRSESPSEVMLNAMFNYSTFPKENVLHLEVVAQQAGTMKVEVETGKFNPPTGKVEDLKWVSLADLNLEEGRNTFAVDVPWKHVSFAAYATPFAKLIGGKRYNQYHFVHIRNLRALAEMTGEPLFTEYADKWEGYVKLWPQIPMYRDSGVELVQR